MWHSLNLGNGADAYGPTQQIIAAFFLVFHSKGDPKDMAIFSRRDARSNDVLIYFSPAASDLAKAHSNAISCERPERDRLELLAGRQDCWDILF